MLFLSVLSGIKEKIVSGVAQWGRYFLPFYKSVLLPFGLSSAPRIFTSQHYVNTPMQYTAIVYSCTKDNLQLKNCDILSYICYNQRL